MASVLFLIFLLAGTYAKPAELTEESINNIDQGTDLDIENQDPIVVTTLKDSIIQSSDSTSTTSKPGLFAWFLTPLTQNLQISPETLQNRVTQIRETLSNLGWRNRNTNGKQLTGNANTLVQLAGPNDSGFYTNRLDPAGFFGGNGWLANKGGILGGPGAILSTGSVLTDYPTAYRRK
ncbi:uncharacterized protein LOC108632869 [Ceratina calcarata]|uniref:Uncharacterized protein LOC108632869 n=1 Tax=Ceratina calcarata TaxID=156304 RepID=A0AAJ7NFX5_9HYME|nr:uncharacterized protein LOC108632869 [Ceratina calcarata]